MKPWMTPERLAERWHGTCERASREYFGAMWDETSWDDTSEDHRALVVATARDVLEWLETERREWMERYIDEALAREREREDANE